MADIGKAAMWAESQPDKAGSWEKVLDFYEGQGLPVDQYRGRPDLMPMVAALSNPNYAKQKAAEANLKAMIQSMPADKQAQATALSAVNPKALTESYAESIFKGEGDINQLIAHLNDEQKEQV